MSAKVMRYYYVKRDIKIVFIYSNEQIFQANTHMEFLGATDNAFPKMAVAAFLQKESGYRIVDYTS